MIEVNTTCSWQMPRGIDSRGLRTSVPASPSRTQSEFGPAWTNKMSASKQANTARLRLTLRRPVVSRCRQESAAYPLTNSFSLSCITSASSCPDFRSADSFNLIHADMGSSVPVLAIFVFEKHNSAADFGIDWSLRLFMSGRPRCGIQIPATVLLHGKISACVFFIEKQNETITRKKQPEY